jgi:F-type H+-transporting ATPase subunit b
MDYILETLGKIGFDWRMGLFNLVNFLIIVWLLKKYAFKPILKIVNDRQKVIQDGLDNATQASTDLKMAEKRAQDIIDTAKVEANKVLEKGSLQAEAHVVKMKDKATKEIELLVTQAKKNIAIERKDMEEELKNHTAKLVVAAVEKIVDERLDDKKDGKLINNALGSS